ncbi:hypothetical protein Tco_0237676 [Tanacetum coccineum]
MLENQNGNVVNENIQENVRNVLVNSNWVGCSYKEFLACHPKQYDVKYTVGSFVTVRLFNMGGILDATQSQEVVVCMSWNDFTFRVIEEFCPSPEMQLGNMVVDKIWSGPRCDRSDWWQATEPKGICRKVMYRFLCTNAEAVRNDQLRGVEKRGNGENLQG